MVLTSTSASILLLLLWATASGLQTYQCKVIKYSISPNGKKREFQVSRQWWVKDVGFREDLEGLRYRMTLCWYGKGMWVALHNDKVILEGVPDYGPPLLLASRLLAPGVEYHNVKEEKVNGRMCQVVQATYSMKHSGFGMVTQTHTAWIDKYGLVLKDDIRNDKGYGEVMEVRSLVINAPIPDEVFKPRGYENYKRYRIGRHVDTIAHKIPWKRLMSKIIKLKGLEGGNSRVNMKVYINSAAFASGGLGVAAFPIVCPPGYGFFTDFEKYSDDLLILEGIVMLNPTKGTAIIVTCKRANIHEKVASNYGSNTLHYIPEEGWHWNGVVSKCIVDILSTDPNAGMITLTRNALLSSDKINNPREYLDILAKSGISINAPDDWRDYKLVDVDVTMPKVDFHVEPSNKHVIGLTYASETNRKVNVVISISYDFGELRGEEVIGIDVEAVGRSFKWGYITVTGEESRQVLKELLERVEVNVGLP